MRSVSSWIGELAYIVLIAQMGIHFHIDNIGIPTPKTSD